MIRINLLREGSRRTARKPSGPGLSVFSPVLLFVASAAVTGAVLGLLWWNWNHQIVKLNQEMVQARAEQARLAAIAAENQRYQQQVKALEDRIRTIQMLEASRTGPVQFMSTLGQTANQASGLYLLTVGPNGDRILLKGMADSVNAIAGFISALKRSGSFNDVQLREYFEDDQTDRVSFKFDLDCQYRGAGGAAAPSQAPTSPAPALPTHPAGASRPGK